MTIKHKLLSAGTLALFLGLTACDNDDSGGSQLSRTDAKTEINAFNNTTKSDLQDLADADGLQAVKDFFQLVSEDDPFGRVGTGKEKLRAFLKDKGTEFKKVFLLTEATKGRTGAEGGFDFEANKGKYSWDEQEGAFFFMGESDNITIYFPTEGSLENNAALRISAYEEVEVVDEFGESYYQPVTLIVAVFVDDTQVVELDLSMEYDEGGFPVVADISLFVEPFTASLRIDATSATSSSVFVSLKEGQETLTAASVTAKYADASKSEESLSSVEGYVQVKNLKLQGSADLTSTSTDFNDIVKLALYANNKKVGDVVFETVNDQQIALIKYADGSTEELEEALQPVIDEFNALSDDLSVNG